MDQDVLLQDTHCEDNLPAASLSLAPIDQPAVIPVSPTTVPSLEASNMDVCPDLLGGFDHLPPAASNDTTDSYFDPYAYPCITNLPGYSFKGLHKGNSYDPTYLCPDLGVLPLSRRLESIPHLVGGVPSQMNIARWEHELSYESDQCLRDYLYYGVRDGFIIVDPDADVPTYDCPNYIAPDSGESYTFVDKLISQEFLDYKYVRAPVKLHCIHSIGTVPKADGKFRPITDCKRPLGASINNYMSKTCETFSYKSVDDVCNLIYPGCYMASVDISSAYRSVSIHPSQWKYQGVRWIMSGSEELLFDVRICFGVRTAPFLFTQISNFITRCMARRGYYHVINYLDDFLIVGDSYSSCQQAQVTLISILISLGFEIAWKKCSSPSTLTQYLGIDFDSIAMQISLPQHKLDKLHSELAFFDCRQRATKRQLQRLCGVLAHCSKVVRGGCTFSRRIIDLLSALPEGNPRITLSSEFHLDLLWWQEFAKTFNGVTCLIHYNFGQGPTIHTDSSFSGYGVVSDSRWLAGYFNSSDLPVGHNSLNPLHAHWINFELDVMNINVLELFPVLLAVQAWGHNWSNQHIVCYSDNTQVVSCVNRGTSTNVHCMSMLREIFWCSAMFNFHITCRHIRGGDNVLPDLLSRVRAVNDLSLISQFGLCCS